MEAEDWDAFLAESGQGHLLQVYGWGELKARFGWTAERLSVTDNGSIVVSAQVLFRKTPLGTLAYIPKGPTCIRSDPSSVALLFDAIHARARYHGAFFLKIEPTDTFSSLVSSLGFKPSVQTIQPRTTIKIDLTPELDLIAKSQKPKTRYNVGLASRKGVEIQHGTLENVAIFYQLLKETSARDGFALHPQEYYASCLDLLGNNVRLLLAFYQNELIAGILVSTFGKESIYLYGASSNLHRNLMPNHLLQWEAIKLARANGCAEYDLWGIPDDVGEAGDENEQNVGSNSSGLEGVYRFKRGFGGQIVRFPGAFDYIYSPLRYRLWASAVPKIQSLRRGRLKEPNA